MTAPLASLLDTDPSVVTVGVDLFADALDAQAVSTTRVDWRPPEASLATALARVAADPRRAPANEQALQRLTGAVPQVVDIIPAAAAVDLSRGELLHAGPPIDWVHASGPLRGGIIGALLYEGWASSPEEAERLAADGDIKLEPCHHRSAVGPMAGVVSPSMPMWVVRDTTFGGSAYCTLNEGLGRVLRYGAFDESVIERLRWMQQVLAPVLRAAVQRHGPLDVRTLVGQALQMGDEGHNRNRAGTSLLLRELLPALFDLDFPTGEVAAAVRFINDNDHFFLNVVMPACKVSADAAAGIPGSTMVVAMARNGTEFGVRVAGTGDQWFTGPAEVPDGLFLGSYGVADANPDIGDSTITETAGIGGFAMAAAPAIVGFVGGRAEDALSATRSMYEIALGEHPSYRVPVLDFRGSPVGIDVTRVVRTGILPVVNTGIAGRVAGVGQVGAGLVRPPQGAFADAVAALAAAVPGELLPPDFPI